MPWDGNHHYYTDSLYYICTGGSLHWHVSKLPMRAGLPMQGDWDLRMGVPGCFDACHVQSTAADSHGDTNSSSFIRGPELYKQSCHHRNSEPDASFLPTSFSAIFEYSSLSASVRE